MIKKKKKKKSNGEKEFYAKFVQWCLDECIRLKKHLHLTSVRISMETTPTKDSERWIFEIVPGHPYQHALLRWTESTFLDWQNKKFEDVSEALLHEMIHCLLDPFVKMARERYITEANFKSVYEEITDKISVILRPHLALRK